MIMKGNEKNNDTLIALTPILSIKDKRYEGAPFTQGTISSIPIGSNISFEGFLLPILLLVVIIVTVVIIVVILEFVVVAIVGVVIVVTIIGVVVVVMIIEVVVVIGVFAIIKLSFVIIGIPPGQGILGESTSSKFHFAVLGTVATRKYRFNSFKPINKTNSSFRTIEVERDGHGDNGMRDPIGGLVSLDRLIKGVVCGGVVDLTGDEDPTDEDGDIGTSDSMGVLAPLGGEISLGGRKSQESNSNNTGGITVGEAIGACSRGI
nr:hypothetical protein [Tanacetum cinerariifolium]